MAAVAAAALLALAVKAELMAAVTAAALLVLEVKAARMAAIASAVPAGRTSGKLAEAQAQGAWRDEGAEAARAEVARAEGAQVAQP
jgi:hypothetical protein